MVASAAYVLYAALILGALLRLAAAVADARPDAPQQSGASAYNLAVHCFGFYAVALLTSYLAQQRHPRRDASSRRRREDLADLQVVHRDVIQSITSGLITTDLDGRGHQRQPRRAQSILRPREARAGRASRSGPSACFDRRAVGRADRAPADGSRRDCAPRSSCGAAARSASSASRSRRCTDADGSHARLHRHLPGPDPLAAAAGAAAHQGPHGRGRRARRRPGARDRQPAGRDLRLGAAALRRSVPTATRAQRKLLEILLKESQRLDRTIKGFLRFARPARARRASRFDIARLLRRERRAAAQQRRGLAPGTARARARPAVGRGWSPIPTR